MQRPHYRRHDNQLLDAERAAFADQAIQGADAP